MHIVMHILQSIIRQRFNLAKSLLCVREELLFWTSSLLPKPEFFIVFL